MIQMPIRRRVVALVACLTAGLVLGSAPVGSAQSAAPTAKKDVDPSLYAELEWRNIGPYDGGRSIAVGGSVARQNEYYFGATGGGLWKTTNGGQDWFPVTDKQITSSSVGAIDVCPTNPDIVYIGMGEVQFRGNVIPGDGVYKTTDGGETWTHLGLSEAHMIGRVRVDPTNCDRVYVAAVGHAFGPNAERGVFRSSDGGASWQRVLFRDELTGAVDLSIDPSNPQVLYATLWHSYRLPWLLWSGGDTSGIFKSTDGGTTWTELTSNPGLPSRPLGKMGVSVSGADPNRVYAIVEASPGGGVYRSDDAGATWQLVNSSANLMQRPFYYMRIYADPVDRERVYVLNVNFFRSNNAGASFSTVSTPHGDNHDLWIAPDNNLRMVEANDGGANVSTTGGNPWTAQDFQTSQMYHVTTTNDEPYLVCGSQQDSSTHCVSSTGGADRFGVGGGESGYIAVDPEDSNVFYAGSYGGNLSRLDRSGLSGIGSRRIDVWPDNPMGHPALNLKHRVQWTFPIITNPAEPDAVFVGSQYVMKTTNGGQSWQQLSPDLTYADPATLGDSGGPITKDQTSIEYFATVFSIAPSPLDPDVVWAGSDDGRVHMTTQGGGQNKQGRWRWEDVTPNGLPKFSTVSQIDAGQHHPKDAYLSAHRYRLDDFSPYIYRTKNWGTTWTKITDGIPEDAFVWAVREDPERKGLLYAGTQHGIYVSFNAGDRWHPLTLNVPDTPISDLVVKDDDLVVATHGRSFWILDDGAALLRRLTPKTTPKDIEDFEQTIPPLTPLPDVDPPDPIIPPTVLAPDQENALAILKDAPDEVRGVTGSVQFSHTLKQAATSATATFLDSQGNTILTQTLQTTAGTRNITWNFRYPGSTTFAGLIYWAGSSTGPLAPLGAYTVRLTVDGQSLEQQVRLLKDERLTHVSEGDIAEQFDLAFRAVARTSDANDGVIAIRDCTAQVNDRVTLANDPAVTAAGSALNGALSAVENELYQTRLRSGQDPLNFPIKLNDKISALRSITESVQDDPTDQTHEVFADLSGQLQVQLDRHAQIVATDVPTFNQLLQTRGLAPIACTT